MDRKDILDAADVIGIFDFNAEGMFVDFNAEGMFAPVASDTLQGAGFYYADQAVCRLTPLLVEFFACALGHDFRHVRLHKGVAVDAFLTRRRAQAIAQGRDLAFATVRFTPHTETGFALLPHDLVHVAQQQAAPSAGASHNPVRHRFAGSHQ
jgi:hypothetical protein